MTEETARTVLIIEDDQSLAEQYRISLIDAGFNATIAAGGEEAFEALRLERPDLILLDLVLPRQGGLNLLKELKDDPAFAGIPVIVLSDFGDARNIEQGIAFGAVGHIVKSQTMPREVAKEVERSLTVAAIPLEHGSVPHKDAQQESG